MAKKSLSIDQILSILTNTPPQIAALADGLAPEELKSAPLPKEWSVNDVLAHLRACADVWGECIETIVNENEPTIKAINPRTWMKRTDYPIQEFRPSLDAFTAQRDSLLAMLGSLSAEDWSRKATVTGAGRPREWTVYDYARRMARHERPHLKQIEKIVTIIGE